MHTACLRHHDPHGSPLQLVEQPGPEPAHLLPCYVVHVTSDDSRRTNDKETHWDRTYWIDKAALVFRKAVEHRNGYIINSSTIHLPYHRDETTTYPVADFNPQTTPEMFRFTPPSDAKEVATFEPQIPGLQSFGHPKVSLVGQIAPNVTFTASDGKKIDLTSFRGKPLLLDFWATWCGPCLLSMPALDRIYRDVKDKGIAVVTVDQETDPEDAAAYLLRHRYNWINYSDADKNIGKAFNGGGIPLTVLIDSQGKVVYEDFGGDEPAVRKAIAALGPEFASIAASEKSPATQAMNAPH